MHKVFGTKTIRFNGKKAIATFEEVSSKHAVYASNLSHQKQANRASTLAASLQAQQNVMSFTLWLYSTKAWYQ